MTGRSNRRDFLRTTTLAGVGFWVATPSARAQSKSPNERVNVGCVGTGGMGSGDVDGSAGAGGTIVALCDVDEGALDGKAKQHPKARKFADFREMFDKMHKDIDAVTVSTPDHTHAVASMMAMKLGKHVRTQKPLTHDVYEARMLTKAAKEHGVCTQMGNQGTTLNGLREAVEVIQSGAIGPVREVHVWTNRPIWPQGIGALLQNRAVREIHIPSNPPAWPNGASTVKVDLMGKPEPIEAPSKTAWDLWLGTAPWRPYDPIYAPFRWRGWWDFGTGALGDMACHTANMAFMACALGYPTSVEAEMSEYNPETFPMWSVIRYEFPARTTPRGEMPPLKWTWYDGGGDKPGWVNEKLKELAHGRKIPGSGSLIIGDKGTLFSPDDYGASYDLLPEKDFKDYKPPTPWLPRVHGKVYEEWISAIRENKPELAMSNFSYAGPLTETVVLGCVAMRARKRIEWDGPNMKITNDKDANQYLKREYRAGWTL